ncbi:MAG TPA: UDP-N-acetylmuramoyl-tripeptide--D-alanyl-D-alanine ligase [Abditibacteriaceae bacterium]|nr:UDP-N-acetylmuramoyl-tripeptide--D-alanyl-D-alanine ligase [Abditibacteriaceae bacterium]
MSEAQAAVNAARFTLREIAAATAGCVLRGNPDMPLCGVLTDTRAVQPGVLFVALPGERFDGHDFLAHAAAAGASAAVIANTKKSAEAPGDLALVAVDDTLKALGDLARVHRRRFDIPVVGVTGSYGKTTTRALIAAALSGNFNMLASSGNFNNEIGVPQTLLQLDETHGAAVIEMGMRGPGQIEYLAQIAQPTIGVITNIGPQHIELLGSVENIAAAKAELLSALPPDGLAVLPADDEHLDFLRSRAPCPVVTFGTSPKADYRVRNIVTGPDGNISYLLDMANPCGWGLSLPLPGAHNAVNAAAAIALIGGAYSVLGISLENAVVKLSKVEVPGARMRIVKAHGLTIIDDCYNAGPDSMRAALATLRDFPGAGRRIAILGAMKELGDWADAEHRKIGELANTCAEAVLGVGVETRALLEAIDSRMYTEWCADAAGAVECARALVREGDVVLVKGSRSVGLEAVVSALAIQ